MSWPAPGRYIYGVQHVSARCPGGRVTRFAGRWCEWKIQGRLKQVVLFLHHHIVTSATAARRCLCLFRAVSGCGERDERNERGRPEYRGSPSMGILRARRNRGDGRDGSIRRSLRLTMAQAVVKQGRLCRLMSSKPVLVRRWEQCRESDDL